MIWRANASDVHAAACRQLLTAACRLTGGEWTLPGTEKPLAIRITATLTASFEWYFRPLLAMVGRLAENGVRGRVGEGAKG